MILLKDIIFIDEDDSWINYQIDEELTIFGRPFYDGEAALSIHRDMDTEEAVKNLNAFLKWLGELEEPLVSHYAENIDSEGANDWYDELDIYGALFIVPANGSVAANISCGSDEDDDILDIEFHNDKIVGMTINK
jgi:hypothetical protein